MRPVKASNVMRLTKGSKVEVFCTTKSFPTGFWRPGQIVFGDGRNYLVQYDLLPSSPQNSTNAEKVLRNAIRPCPPARNKPIKWVSGDVVEVFVHGAWKVGKITSIAHGNNFYSVVFVGHAEKVSVRLRNMRRVQTWENNKWLLVKKDSTLVHRRVYKELPCLSESTSISSTGSCDTSGRPYQHDIDVCSHCDSDAESTITATKYISKSAEKKPELEKYRSTMVALHANGPMSWEQEALLTDLRISLNISIDEHRSILKSLAPPKKLDSNLSLRLFCFN